jgi:hypothetical protein
MNASCEIDADTIRFTHTSERRRMRRSIVSKNRRPFCESTPSGSISLDEQCQPEEPAQTPALLFKYLRLANFTSAP